MNLKAKKDAVGRQDEIIFSSDVIKYLTNSKNKAVNVQSVLFSPRGDLVALAMKSGLLLIMDFITMGIVRVFCSNEEFSLSANEDVDQFYPFWKFMNYFEDDFVFKFKPQESQKDCEAFLQEKYSSRRARDSNVEFQKRINIQEQKQSQSKITIASMSWSENQVLIGVLFKQTENECLNNFVVWDYITCQRLIQIDFGKQNICQVMIVQNHLLVSGDQSFLMEQISGNFEKLNKILFTVQETKQMPQDAGNSKRKGTVVKAFNQIALSCGEQFLLVSNTQKCIYLLKQHRGAPNNYINSDDFDILAQRQIEQSPASFVNSASLDQKCEKVILNCSDRILRLYQITKNQITLVETFKDVVNNARQWLSAQFLMLPDVTKVINDTVQERIPQTTLTLLSSQKYANENQEIFVAASGESSADSLHFFNASGKFKEIQKIELQQEGVSNMSAFSGSHLSLVLASNNGSLLVWCPKPAKLIQPLAPNFIEIEDNVMYVEREDEFEEQKSDDDVMEIDDDVQQLIPLTRKQKKLQAHIDFPQEKQYEYLQVQVHTDDSFAVTARKTINQLREKFNSLLPQGQQMLRQR